MRNKRGEPAVKSVLQKKKNDAKHATCKMNIQDDPSLHNSELKLEPVEHVKILV